jgi:type I restriction enzyme S subunit
LASGVAPTFVEKWLQSNLGRSLLTQRAKWAVNQASINQADIGITPVPIPPLPEQHRIVAEVERRLSVVAKLETAVAANLARAGRLRQAVLKRAFEGRLVGQEAVAS